MDVMQLLTAPHMGVAELRAEMSSIIRERKTVVATEKRGKPAEVVMPYDTLIQLLTQLRDLSDKRMEKVVDAGFEAIRSGSKGVSARPGLKKHLAK